MCNHLSKWFRSNLKYMFTGKYLKFKSLKKQHLNLAFLLPPQYWSLSSNPSFKGSIVNGGGKLSLAQKLNVLPSTSGPTEIPPKVPPRRESIGPQSIKPELPIQLISTTNQVSKPAAVQQQIPTKLAALSKGKDKGFKTKGHHQRTHSAGQDPGPLT